MRDSTFYLTSCLIVAHACVLPAGSSGAIMLSQSLEVGKPSHPAYLQSGPLQRTSPRQQIGASGRSDSHMPADTRRVSRPADQLQHLHAAPDRGRPQNPTVAAPTMQGPDPHTGVMQLAAALRERPPDGSMPARAKGQKRPSKRKAPVPEQGLLTSDTALMASSLPVKRRRGRPAKKQPQPKAAVAQPQAHPDMPAEAADDGVGIPLELHFHNPLYQQTLREAAAGMILAYNVFI